MELENEEESSNEGININVLFGQPRRSAAGEWSPRYTTKMLMFSNLVGLNSSYGPSLNIASDEQIEEMLENMDKICLFFETMPTKFLESLILGNADWNDTAWSQDGNQ